MTDQSAEPTMEEILASIRRIISEDDAPGAQASAQPDEAEAAEDEPELTADAEDDVLELTDPIDEPQAASAPEPASAPAPVERSGDLDIFDNSAMAAAPAPAPARSQPRASQPAPSFMDDQEEGLVSEPAAASAASAFGQLSQRVTLPAQGEAQALDDVVRELLRPLLRDWLDRNLTAIVEQAVEAEVERIARRSVR